MDFEEKTLEREIIFEGKVITVAVDQVALPNGGESQRELVFHRGAVAVLAVTEEGKLILVKQYRKAIEAVTYEIPAGKLEEGEQEHPEQAALRELEEETGYTGKLTFICDFYTALGFCDEKIQLYLATDLVKLDNPASPDEDEQIQLMELSYSDCLAMLQEGQIKDAKTLIALQHYALRYGG